MRHALRPLSSGFTLIELMVTLAIVAILGTMAAPSFRDFMVRNSTAAIANEFTGSLLRARTQATSRNMCVSVCRSETTTSATPTCAAAAGNWQTGWMVFQNPSCDPTNASPAIENVVSVVNSTNGNFSLVAANTPSGWRDTIVLSPTGYPLSNATVGGYDLRYRSETRPSNRRICFNALGQVAIVAFQGTCP